MSLLSIDDWNEFLFQVGSDFYDLVHDQSDTNDEFTKVQYPYTYQSEIAGLVTLKNSPLCVTAYKGNMSLVQGQQIIIDNVSLLKNTNYTNSDALNIIDDIHDFTFELRFLNSFVSPPVWISSTNTVYKQNASGTWLSNICYWSYSFYNGSQFISDERSGVSVELPSRISDCYQNYNGYDYYFTNLSSTFNLSDYTLPQSYGGYSHLKNYPCLVNTVNFNSSNTFINNVKNNYYNSNNGDTITNYTYNIDNSSDTINVTYTVDSDGVPTGYIDINPTGNFSFDDLFDMFNTILAPLVGVGLDLPDWTDYEPEYPIVTGDINVNIDLPDVTGEYPAETITPIDSDVYNIISIDSMPHLPSLTGIDNGESAAALGSSFTFLDGCGLLMPFVTIAIIRLLISKFRGDS